MAGWAAFYVPALVHSAPFVPRGNIPARQPFAGALLTAYLDYYRLVAKKS